MTAESAGDVEAAMTAFQRASRIVEQQVVRERRLYPFRVAALYASFYNKWERRLSAEERNEVGGATKKVVERILTLPEHARNNRVVARCEADLGGLISRLESQEG